MYVTGKHLSRRAAIRGLGATIALPFLEAMVPAQTPHSKPSPRRLACIEMVHGAAGSTEEGARKHYWSPSQEGRDFGFSYTLETLETYRDYITVITGTDAQPAEPATPSETGADHFRSSAVFLTAAHAKQTSGPDVRNGTSIDQLYACQAGRATRLPSLQLSIENIDLSESCGFQYNCVYSETISWASPTRPLPMVVNPREVFESLLSAPGPSSFARQATRASVLDSSSPSAGRLGRTLSPADRRRLDAHLAEIRDIERRIQAVEKRNAAALHREIVAPLGVPDSWEEHVKLMFDLQALAFAADITRVSAFKMSRDTSNRLFPESGVDTPFHTLSHHIEKPALIAEFARLNRYHVSLVPYFLEKLKSTPDGDGNLLDHSLVLYGSPMGDSNFHNHRRLPIFLAGHAGGSLKGNLHRVCEPGTPHANTLLTVGRKLGLDLPAIGDSTGEIDI